MSEYIGVERRRSPRIPDGIKVRIVDITVRRAAPILNISYHGALLRTRCFIDSGKIINLSMYIPTESNPLYIEARVVRIVTVCSPLGFLSYDIGVEFLNLIEDQKEKLSNTMDYLLKKAGQNRGERWKIGENL